VHPQAAQPITERRTFDVQAEHVKEQNQKDS
jgi:sec-independent protein translocase protein TatA